MWAMPVHTNSSCPGLWCCKPNQPTKTCLTDLRFCVDCPLCCHTCLLRRLTTVHNLTKWHIASHLPPVRDCRPVRHPKHTHLIVCTRPPESHSAARPAVKGTGQRQLVSWLEHLDMIRSHIRRFVACQLHIVKIIGQGKRWN